MSDGALLLLSIVAASITVIAASCFTFAVWGLGHLSAITVELFKIRVFLQRLYEQEEQARQLDNVEEENT